MHPSVHIDVEASTAEDDRNTERLSTHMSQTKPVTGAFTKRTESPGKDRSDLATLQRKTREVWELVLRNSMSLHRLPTNATKESHLYVDWSGVGTGYALFSGPMSEGLLIGINSRREANGTVSSMLGELRGLCWALEEVKVMTAGTRIVVWTDSQSVYNA